jgi:predicted glycosyltransferase
MTAGHATAPAPARSRAKALIYVQHLLGIGHMARIQRIAACLLKSGMTTVIVQGGAETGLPPVPGVEMVSLTPVRVDADDMDTLLHDDGRPFTDLDRDARRDALLALLGRVRPDILLIEAFPFGRRQHRFELIPLLETARATGVPVIASSIRDVLRDKRKPGRAEETVDLIARYFDLVLVHGEERLTPLSATFPLARLFAEKTRYTGLVGPEVPVSAPSGHAIVVSAGGGAFGTALIETAVLTAARLARADRRWLVLAGQNMLAGDFERIAALAAPLAPRVDFRRNLPDLCSVLQGTEVSVSQAGYNTVADILVAGCRAVLVPYVTIKENEQYDRTIALAAAGRVVHLPQETLSPDALAGAILAAMQLPRPKQAVLDGGTVTAQILRDALAEHHPGCIRRSASPPKSENGLPA